jgi:hypothetical protein
MKRLALGALVATICLPATGAMAQGYGMAGCGLGSLVFGNKPGFVQAFAATTNGTFGSQTFGITTGTSNCESKKGAAAEEEGGKEEGGKKEKKKKKGASIIEQTNFVTANLESLRKESAQGGGETVSALSSAVGCDATLTSAFAASVQGAHAEIFATSEPSEVLARVKSAARGEATLASGCEALN